jgi:hypothetical protein
VTGEVTIDDTWWAYQISRIIEAIIVAIHACVSFVIFFFARKKWMEKQKSVPYLLSRVYAIFTLALNVQVFTNFVTLRTPTEQVPVTQSFLVASSFLLLVPGVMFIFLFVLELFRDGIFAPKNRKKLFTLYTLDLVTFGLLIIMNLNNAYNFVDLQISNYLGILAFLFGAIIVLYSFFVQGSTAFKIWRKEMDEGSKKGVFYIGISGYIYAVAVLLEGVESLMRELNQDLIVNIIVVSSALCVLAGSITIFRGYIYPSLK